MLATSIEKLVNVPLQDLTDRYGTTAPRIITNPSKKFPSGYGHVRRRRPLSADDQNTLDLNNASTRAA